MFLITPTTLKQRFLVSSGWTAAGYGLSQVIRFGSNLLMTRLLVPEMFGVMAIATMIMYGLAMFSDLGLGQSIVRSKRGGEADFLNTAWAIQILRGALLWGFALGFALIVVLANRMGMAPPGSVYAEPSLPYVIGVLAASAFISGFASTKLHEASRVLALGRITQIEIIGQVAGLLCMIGWAALDRSIWSLVAGSICSTLVSTLLSHVWLPGVSNRWQWDNAAMREIVHFGKWIFVSSILGFFVNSGDRLILGGLLSTAALGVYVIAFFIFSAIESGMTKIIADVSFPALSEIARERPHDLKSRYYRLHVVVAASACFFSGILIISGQVLVDLLYDRRYGEAGWMLEILAVALLVAPAHVATQCFLALGMPRLISILAAIRLAMLFLITPVGFHFFGLPGAIWAIVLSYISYVPVTLFYKVKHGLFDLRRELLPLPAVLAGVVAGITFNWAVRQ